MSVIQSVFKTDINQGKGCHTFGCLCVCLLVVATCVCLAGCSNGSSQQPPGSQGVNQANQGGSQGPGSSANTQANSANSQGPGHSANTQANSANSQGKSQNGSNSGQAAAWPKVSVTRVAQLPAAQVGTALTADGKALLAVGGYTGKRSLTAIDHLDARSGRVTKQGDLPRRLHDAAATMIGKNLYVFGGGTSVSFRTIYSLDASSGKVTLARRLSTGLSDAVAVPYAWKGQQGALLLGGYDGKQFNLEARFVSVSSDGKLHWQNLFQLPVGVRYPGVAVQGTTVYIAGGQTPSGLNDKVYSWQPGGQPKTVASLDHGFQKAAAFTWNQYLVIAGGLNGAGQASKTITAIDTRSGQVRTVGQLPSPLADMGYSQISNHGYTAGGLSSSKPLTPTRAVYQLTFH